MDWEKLKTPVFLVQEFGWNMFRLAATAEIALKSTEFCHLLTNTKVINIQDLRSDSASHNWEIQTEKEHFPVNYLINASGFQNRTLESFLPVKAEGWTEFKASYLSKWTSFPFPLPELVFHGERGTPTGMTQLTPYPEGFFQIHGMRPGISLFQGGLIKNLPQTRKPDFGEEIRRLLTRGWSPQEARGRTDQAIDFVSRFLPSFQSAEMGGLPLYGAQQIIGEEANLRVAEVSFPAGHYARIETIKASSTLSAARKISEDIFRAGLQEQGDLPPGSNAPGENALIQSVLSHEIDGVAKKITQNRGLPESLSRLLIPRGPGV